jgi:hypothetical protein
MDDTGIPLLTRREFISLRVEKKSRRDRKSIKAYINARSQSSISPSPRQLTLLELIPPSILFVLSSL